MIVQQFNPGINRIAVYVIGIIVIVTGSVLGYQVMNGYDQTTHPGTLRVVQQQPVRSAKTVAGQLKCTKFHALGPAPAAKVLDSGTCWLNGKKYGIDTFATEIDRDIWVADTAGYGVKVKWESANSVVYPSLSKSDY